MFWKITDRLLLPAAFFLIAFVVALTFWQLLISYRPAENQAAINEQALFVKSKIESELRVRILPLELLAAPADF
jgi:sensor domain CHASE-containing protein